MSVSSVPTAPLATSAVSSARASCAIPEKCFAQARRAIDANEIERAHGYLMEIRAQWPESIWSGRAAFLLGKTAVEGDQTATEWALRASSELPVIADYALAMAARKADRDGSSSRSAEIWGTLLRLYPKSPLVPEALLGSAEVWASSSERRSDAIMRFRELIDRFPRDPRAPKALVDLGNALVEEQLVAEAGAAFRKLWTEFPATPEEAAITQRLDELVREGGVPPASFDERRKRADALGRAGRHGEALELYAALVRVAPTTSVAREMALQKGITLYRLRKWDEAWTLFRLLGRPLTPPDLREEALLWAGRAAFRREDLPSIRRAETSLASAFPTSPRRLELLSLRASWHRGRGEVPAALDVYHVLARVADELHRSDKVVEAQWSIGWLEYRRGHLSAARAAFDGGLASAAPSDPQIPQLMYWRAHLDAAAGSTNSALIAATDLIDRYPYTYYGYLVRRAMGLTPSAPAPERILPATNDSGSEWEPLYPRVAELWLLGCGVEARDELVATVRATPPTAGQVPTVAGGLAQVGADDEALRLLRRSMAPALEKGDATLSPTVWKLAYPGRLLETIRRLDARDPYLVAALIREESVYDPRAVSPVGAMGLMQIMPDTGRRMARTVGLADFTIDQLFVPEVNLRLGVRYLEDLLDRFAGNSAYAVAAYNAGPEAVVRWIENNPPRSIEEFIEEIPFAETRWYVKRVLRSLWEYQTLYGASVTARRS